MSEKKVTGFAALMKMRRKQNEEADSTREDVKPVIKEVSLTCT